MEFLLSIVTINYNNKAGLQKTVQSVVDQSYNQFEYVVIDGGSNDGSLEIISQNEKSIHYAVSEKDAGIYNAMNKGILAAHGKYILFLNSGDVLFAANTLADCIPALSLNYDFVYGNTFFDKHGKRSFVNYPDKLSFSFFLTDSLCHQSTFIKRELFENSLYNETAKIVSDWEFFVIKICKENKTSHHVNETVSVFDVSGASSEQLAYNESERAVVIEQYFPAFVEDYNYVRSLKLRRIKQLVFISKKRAAWKFLKLVINFIIFLIPSAKEKLWRS
ncbi:MAG: glycosyltransferase family 2 protein [Ferruginibacter sp.]